MITFTIAILISILPAKCQDGFTDENRPYKFGFNIEGHQHRYEEKDEKGIIKGEYGFITADGFYHLTVYATDENGNFKILKTKNIKIGLPMMTTTTPIPGIGAQRLQKVNQIVPKKNPDFIKLNGKPACGGCLIPTQAEKEQLKIKPIRGQIYTNNRNAISENRSKMMENRRNRNQKLIDPENLDPALMKNFDSKTKVGSTRETKKEQKTMKEFQNRGLFGTPRNRVKPMTFEKKQNYQNSKVDGDNLGPSYKFNYTLTFNGHEETGNGAGEKKGSYFVQGRDGYRRQIDYNANEFGYQPKVKFQKIDPQQTPEEKTEKERAKLLGNEFVWFYNMPQ